MTTERDRVAAAIERSWRPDTSAQPERWAGAHPSLGQCDVSSFVMWERQGGVLVLGEVRVDGEVTEHHDWNRIDGVDLDLTAAQFTGREEIREIDVVTGDEIEARRATMRPELAERIARLRRRVDDELGATSG